MSVQDQPGRSSGRVTNPAASDLARGTDGTVSRDDCLSIRSPIRRVRPARAETIIGSLDSLQRALTADVGRARLATGGQLRRLHFPDTGSGKRHARRVLEGLVNQRVLTRLGRTIGGRSAGSTGFVYSLDVVGQRLLDPLAPLRRPWLPSQAFVNHAVMVTECYVQLREAEQAGRLELLEFQTEPSCWRDFVDRRGSHRTLKPDAFVRIASDDFEDLWFLECDRGTEDLARIRRKNQVYVDYWQTGKEAVYPRVLWIGSRPERARALAGCLTEMPAEHQPLFASCDLDGFMNTITSGPGDGETK
jgi:hypothetical protein